MTRDHPAKYLYRGKCQTCGVEKHTYWHVPYVNDDGGLFYASDCGEWDCNGSMWMDLDEEVSPPVDEKEFA